jgi:hypothetical protein
MSNPAVKNRDPNKNRTRKFKPTGSPATIFEVSKRVKKVMFFKNL